MTQEQKARAYDEALERAKDGLTDKRFCETKDTIRSVVEYIFPQLTESDDERIREEMIRYFTEMKKGGSASLPYDDCIAYLERRKETGIQWLKSDNVKNPDKPYIDKAGMFYTTDGKMCHASEIEKRKPAEWSEEDKKRISEIEFAVMQMKTERQDTRDKCLAWLKSLRPPLKDREMKLKILKYLSTRCSSLEYEEVEDYLNNLRPSWKPSEEQIHAIIEALKYLPNNKDEWMILNTLADILRKLM